MTMNHPPILEAESLILRPLELSDASRIWTLAGILKEADPEGALCPLLLSGVTGGRFFSRLGIQTCGFLPMPLPEGFNITQAVHAADERIPVGALWFGARAIHQPLQRFSL